MEVIMYSKKNCSLCDKALKVLELLQQEFQFTVREVDIYKDEALLEKYQIMIPVVEIDGHELEYGIVTGEIVRQYLDDHCMNS